MVKVVIDGSGRAERLTSRQMFETESYRVVAISDLMKPEVLVHPLEYGTSQGSFLGKVGEGKRTVEAGEDSIIVDGEKITIYKGVDAKNLPWKVLDVDVVLECTGFYTSEEKALIHLKAGAKKVVISTLVGNDPPTIVFNVNEKTLTKEDKIISITSCTTNCLILMARALNDYAPIRSSIMSAIHAYIGDQTTLNGPRRKGDLGRLRVDAASIVPNSTGTVRTIGLVIPELNGKLIGSVQRALVTTGSAAILVTIITKGEVTKEEINAAMRAAASESFGYNTDEIVFSDAIGIRYGPLFDTTQTMVNKIADDCYQVQVVSRYDNENSYTSRMARTIEYSAES